MAMDTPIIVSAIAAVSSVMVAAISFYLTKEKDREADWRKYKFDQYKEFLDSMAGGLRSSSNMDDKARFTKASNSLHLIASPGVLAALHEILDPNFNPNRSQEKHDVMLSKLIWEIRQDIRIPGTPKASEFTARLWGGSSDMPKQ